MENKKAIAVGFFVPQVNHIEEHFATVPYTVYWYTKYRLVWSTLLIVITIGDHWLMQNYYFKLPLSEFQNNGRIGLIGSRSDVNISFTLLYKLVQELTVIRMFKVAIFFMVFWCVGTAYYVQLLYRMYSVWHHVIWTKQTYSKMCRKLCITCTLR